MKLPFLLLLILASASAFAQPRNSDGTEILDSAKRLQTDVFILNTCAPTQLSLARLYDDARKIKQVPLRKLSINVNRFSAFKIININPLRYSYYINDELVTQFMESNLIMPENNSFLKGTYLPVNDIEQVNIFTSGREPSEQKKILNAQKAKSAVWKDSLDRINEEIAQIDDKLYKIAFYDYNKREWVIDTLLHYLDFSKANKIKAQLIDQRESKEQIYQNYSYRYSRALDEYVKEMSNLTINTDFDFLNGYTFSKYNVSSEDSTHDLGFLIKAINDFATQKSKLKNDFALVAGLAANETDYSLSANFRRHQIDSILGQYGYQSSSSNPSVYTQSSAYTLRRPELLTIDAKEFMLDKKYKYYEAFLLKLAADAGKLLQNQFNEYSQQLNSFYNQNCLTDDLTRKSDSIREKIVNTFQFIQDLSADFSVVVNYFDLDSKRFDPIVANIKTFYTRLLKFLKYLDYIEQNNTVEFSLPTHNNLKNIDLIRYKIDREDKLTKSKQTYSYDIWIHGGFKIDFSAGIFATGLIDYDFDKTQVFNASGVAVPDSVFINRKDKGMYDFAFGGMVNISYRLGTSWVIPALSVGVAYANNKSLQFLAGLSLQCGKTERLIFHAGFAGGLSKQIDLSKLIYDEIESNKRYKIRGSFEEFNVPVIDRFSIKPFFGISYNLSRKNALQAVSGAGNDAFREHSGNSQK